MKTRWIGLFVCALAAACGSSSNSNADGGPMNPDGQVLQTGAATLSGAISGTANVSVAGIKADSVAFTTVAIAGISNLPTNVQGIVASISFNGAPTVHTYASGELMNVAVTITTKDNKTYAAGSGYGTVGSLNITSTTSVNHDPVSMATAYRLGGTFSATLVNLTSATDTIMLNVTF